MLPSFISCVALVVLIELCAVNSLNPSASYSHLYNTKRGYSDWYGGHPGPLRNQVGIYQDGARTGVLPYGGLHSPMVHKNGVPCDMHSLRGFPWGSIFRGSLSQDVDPSGGPPQGTLRSGISLQGGIPSDIYSLRGFPLGDIPSGSISQSGIPSDGLPQDGLLSGKLPIREIHSLPQGRIPSYTDQRISVPPGSLPEDGRSQNDPSGTSPSQHEIRPQIFLLKQMSSGDTLSGALPLGSIFSSNSLHQSNISSGISPQVSIPSGNLPQNINNSGIFPQISSPSNVFSQNGIYSGIFPPVRVTSGGLPPGIYPQVRIPWIPPTTFPLYDIPPAIYPQVRIPPGDLPQNSIPPAFYPLHPEYVPQGLGSLQPTVNRKRHYALRTPYITKITLLQEKRRNLGRHQNPTTTLQDVISVAITVITTIFKPFTDLISFILSIFY